MEAIDRQGSDPRIYETTVKQIYANADGQIDALETIRLQKSSEGRMVPVPGSEKILPCGLLLIAAGFIGCEEQTLSQFHLAADARGRLLPEDQSHHLRDNLVSAGDMRTGQSLVVRALADGRSAAKELDLWLRAY